MRLSFKDLPHFTKIYYKETGFVFFVFLGIVIFPAYLDSVGITMVVPLLALVDRSAFNINSLEDNFAFRLLQYFNIPAELNYILLFILGIYTVKFIVASLSGLIRARLIADLTQRTRKKMFERYIGLDYQFYSSKNTGYFINVINLQVNQFVSGFAYMTIFYSKFIAAVSYLIFSFFIDWKFSLIAVSAGLLLLLIFRRINSVIKTQSAKTASDEGKLSSLFIQALQAFKYLKSTNSFDRLRKATHTVIDRIKLQRLKIEQLRSLFDAANEPIIILFIVALVYVQIQVFEKSLGSLILSIYLFNRALSNILITQKEWQYVLNLSGGINTVVNELKNTRNHQEKNGSLEIRGFKESLSIEEVDFQYGMNNPVVRKLNLVVPKNAMVALVGSSGAGKTTMIDLISGLLSPTGGAIKLDGIDLRTTDINSWRKRIGFVTQDVVLFDDTIANNISLWEGDYNNSEFRTKIENAARQAYCHEFIELLPDGYLSPIGEKGVRLSGGQRQRLAIARELYKQPDLLILDEATSALDSKSEGYIHESILGLKGKVTVIIIAHRLATIKQSDFIVVLDKGQIVEGGNFKELTASQGTFSKMVELQTL